MPCGFFLLIGLVPDHAEVVDRREQQRNAVNVLRADCAQPVNYQSACHRPERDHDGQDAVVDGLDAPQHRRREADLHQGLKVRVHHGEPQRGDGRVQQDEQDAQARRQRNQEAEDTSTHKANCDEQFHALLPQLEVLHQEGTGDAAQRRGQQQAAVADCRVMNIALPKIRQAHVENAVEEVDDAQWQDQLQDVLFILQRLPTDVQVLPVGAGEVLLALQDVLGQGVNLQAPVGQQGQRKNHAGDDHGHAD